MGSNEELAEKVAAVKGLVEIFKLERIVYLVISGLGLVLLLVAAVILIIRSKADAGTLTLIFGSSGLMTVSIGRVLRMWDQAIRLVSGEAPSKPKEGSHA